jgi:phage tail-like protein
MPTGDRKDPFRGFNFKLEIDGVICAGFRECSGLENNENLEDVLTRTEPGPTSIGGRPKYNNITLKHGVSDDHSLVKWGHSPDAKTQRKNGSIILEDEAGNETVRWNFVEGWPIKWTGPTFNLKKKNVAIHAIQLEHEGITRS